MKDLVLLVADKNAQFALRGALGRCEALGMHPIEFEFRVHPGHDGGVRKSGPELLKLERRRFSHALVVLDFEGSGAAQTDALALEAELDGRLQAHWAGQAKAIAIEPELDVWMWGSDNAVEEVINWPAGYRLRAWLRQNGFEFNHDGKPVRPKEAIEAALRVPAEPRSSALYQRIAQKISLHRCTDPAFHRLLRQLVAWFPQ